MEPPGPPRIDPQRRRVGAAANWRKKGEYIMFGIIAAILVVGWLLGFFVFHVSSALIHLLIVIAVVLIIVHFITGRRRLL